MYRLKKSRYKKLFHLLIEKNMTNAQLQQEAGFSANIITRLKRNRYISLESVERMYKLMLNRGLAIINIEKAVSIYDNNTIFREIEL